MIIHPNNKNKARIKALEDKYDALLAEAEAKVDALRDPGELPKKIKEKKLTSEAIEEWLSSGSEAWHEAVEEFHRIELELDAERQKLYDDIAREEFAKLEGDKKKILDHARKQTIEFIEGRKILVLQYKYIDSLLDPQILLDDLKECLELHYEFFKDDPLQTAELDGIVSSAVENAPYISVKLKTKKHRDLKKISVFDNEQEFLLLSSTQPCDLLYNLLSKNVDVQRTANSINAIGKKSEAESYDFDGHQQGISLKTNTAEIRIEMLSSASKVSGKAAKKIFLFIQNELYEQLYYDGQMNSYELWFPLKKMVDKKLYTSTQNARRAFYDASNFLTAFRISGFQKSGKNTLNIAPGNKRVILFPTMEIVNGECFIRLNPDVNWTPLLKDYIRMPDAYWTLSDNASDLLVQIFRMIRAKSKTISKNGSITYSVKLSTVAEWLNLPVDAHDNKMQKLVKKNPKKLVKEPIEQAVKQLSESLSKQDFSLKLVTDLNAQLDQYLSGYLEVTASGIYTDALNDISDTRKKKIAHSMQRKQIEEGKKNDNATHNGGECDS